MNLRKKYKHSLLVPTSMGVRITPINGQPINSSNIFQMHVTSAETNVSSISSSLGLPVKVLTKFVKDSPIADLIKKDLASRHMDYEGVEIPQGGPWGYRHQINIADSGFGVRGPSVHNDRAGEIGRTLSVFDFDLERIFYEEGVQLIHLSGLIAALSPETAKFCLELARYAKDNGTKVSFDLNYRASFWKGREKELRKTFMEITSIADILIGNEEDYQLCLGINGPETAGKDIKSKIDNYREMIYMASNAFLNIKVFATTLREVISSNCHLWGAIMLHNNKNYIVEPREITVLDRIGGGDGFVGGLLYGILKNWEPQKCIEFGWASGALVTTLLTDYALPSSEEELWRIWQGNARVKR